MISQQLDEYGIQADDSQGPSELTITHPDVYQAIDGPGNACSKADWYDLNHPLKSLFMTRDRKSHDNRWRIWDQGFSTKGQTRFLSPSA